MNKYTYLLLVANALYFNSLSQTITASDIQPVIGDHFRPCQPTTSAATLTIAGPSGQNQYWNVIHFSCAGYTPYHDTIVAPTNAQSNAISGTNLIRSYNKGVGSAPKWYLKASSNGLEKLAVVTSTTDTIHYSNPELLVPYPLIFENTHSDQFTSSFSYTQNSTAYTYLQSGVKNFTIDAQGALITPSGNYPNTLRVFSRTSITQTLLPSQSISTYTTDRYEWYSPGTHEPLLIISNIVGSPKENQTVSFLSSPFINMVGINEEGHDLEKLSIFPNPASNIIYIKAKDYIILEAKITNALGQVVVHNKNSLNENYQIDISSLEEGLYFAYLTTSSGAILKEKFIIKH